MVRIMCACHHDCLFAGTLPTESLWHSQVRPLTIALPISPKRRGPQMLTAAARAESLACKRPGHSDNDEAFASSNRWSLLQEPEPWVVVRLSVIYKYSEFTKF